MRSRLTLGPPGLLSAAIIILGCSCGSPLSAQSQLPAAEPLPLIGAAVSFETPATESKLVFGLGDFDQLAWYIDWLSRHQSIGAGETWLMVDRYLSASPGTRLFSLTGAKKRPVLPPAGIGAVHLMYGVRDVPTPNILRRIRATAHFDERDLETAQLQIGYANYDSGRFQISVPFTPGEEISMSNLWADNVNEGGRGYIVIIVTGTQHESQLWSLGLDVAPPGSAL